MRLEQTIQRSKKSPGGIIGQTRKEAYISEWELVYHETLAISNCFASLTKSKGGINELHHELTGNADNTCNEAVSKVFEFISTRRNPYSCSATTQLHNFTSGQVVPLETSSRLTSFFIHGREEYLKFRTERFTSKTKLLNDTITKVNLPKMNAPKHKAKSSSQNVRDVTKYLGQAQREIDVARSRGISMNDILRYDHTMTSPLFDEDGLTSKPNKYALVKELEKNLENRIIHLQKKVFMRLQL